MPKPSHQKHRKMRTKRRAAVCAMRALEHADGRPKDLNRQDRRALRELREAMARVR